MRHRRGFCVVAMVLLVSGAAVAQQQTPPPVTAQDCTKLKGKAKKDCVAASAAPAQSKSAGTGSPAADDKFAFPEDESKTWRRVAARNGDELSRCGARDGRYADERCSRSSSGITEASAAGRDSRAGGFLVVFVLLFFVVQFERGRGRR